MPVVLDIHARIEGIDVADAKAQLVSLFGVALGRVAIVDETASAPSALNANGALSDPVPVVMEGDANTLERSPMPGSRRRRTRAEIDAAKAAEAVENAPQPEPQAPVNGAAAPAAADEPEETIDLLGGGNAEEEVDPFAEDPPKQLAATATPKLDKDAMMAKGREVLNKHGMPKLTAILAKHGFKRIAELPEHTYPTVWADLEESLA